MSASEVSYGNHPQIHPQVESVVPGAASSERIWIRRICALRPLVGAKLNGAAL